MGGMVKFMNCFDDVPRHGDINTVADALPFQIHTAVKCTNGIGGDCVEIAKCVGEMGCIVVTHGFNSKIIDDKGEGYGSM